MAKSRELKTRKDGVKQHYNTGSSVTSNADARAAFNPRPAKKEEPVAQFEEEEIASIEGIGGEGSYLWSVYTDEAKNAVAAARALLDAEANDDATDALRWDYESAADALAERTLADWGSAAMKTPVAGPNYYESVREDVYWSIRKSDYDF